MLCLALKMSINLAYIHLKALLGSAQHVLVETSRSFSCQSRFLNFSAADAAQSVPGLSNELHLINRAREPVLTQNTAETLPGPRTGRLPELIFSSSAVETSRCPARHHVRG